MSDDDRSSSEDASSAGQSSADSRATEPRDDDETVSDVLVTLPASMRADLKEPMGPIFTDAERLLSAVEGPLVAVGDVVTYHLEAAGVTPDVAVVDGLTKREAVDDEVAAAVSELGERVRRVEVENPAGALTRELLVALREAIDAPEPTVLVVAGEEDLVTLPAIVAAPVGASVVYGQPNEGMVHAKVTDEAKTEMRDLLARMDGDADAVFEILDAE